MRRFCFTNGQYLSFYFLLFYIIDTIRREDGQGRAGQGRQAWEGMGNHYRLNLDARPR